MDHHYSAPTDRKWLITPVVGGDEPPRLSLICPLM